MEEKTFVCKYCFRRFVCGKSLGGHIRTHMMSENEEKRMNAAAAAVFKFDDGRKRKRSELGSSGGVGVGGDDGNYIYGLRENPKKTTRFVHSNAAAAASVAATVQMEKFCKECGRGFPSLKALCGHMASHSEKDKVINRIEGVSGVGVREKDKLVLDSQSDTEESVPTDTRKTKRMKFKNVNGGGNDNRPSSSSPPWGNCSSSISEVDQEHEEVARTLMMMSRDYSFKGHFALGTESSDNNSAVVEAKSKLKSPYVDTKVVAMNHGKSVSIVGTEKKKVNKGRKLLVYDVGYDCDNSDSGYFLFGPKNVELDDASSDWCLRNRFEDHGFESSKKIISRGERSRNSDEFKGPNYDSVERNLVENSNKKNIQNGYGIDENDSLKIEREREGFSDDSVYESDENSTDSDSYIAPKNQTNNKNMNGKKSNKKSNCKGKKKMKSKKSKEHHCPICNRSFRSGQALGGHKRSHFVGGYDENTLVLRPGAVNPAQAPAPAPAPVNPAPAPAAVNPCLIDLNLPAPDDE